MAQLFVPRKRFWPRSDKNPEFGIFFLTGYANSYAAIALFAGVVDLQLFQNS
jgi:hypothetical protein